MLIYSLESSILLHQLGSNNHVFQESSLFLYGYDSGFGLGSIASSKLVGNNSSVEQHIRPELVSTPPAKNRTLNDSTTSTPSCNRASPAAREEGLLGLDAGLESMLTSSTLSKLRRLARRVVLSSWGFGLGDGIGGTVSQPAAAGSLFGLHCATESLLFSTPNGTQAIESSRNAQVLAISQNMNDDDSDEDEI